MYGGGTFGRSGGAVPRTGGAYVAGDVTITGTTKTTRLWATGKGTVALPAVTIGPLGSKGVMEDVNGAACIVTAGATPIACLGAASYLNTLDVVGAVTLGSYIELAQSTTPAAPAAGKVRVYNVDNGAGKSQTRALFDTGAAQVTNTEPP